MKAFLGTGLLGAGFVRAMLKKGEEVHVWNRTFSKAKDLELYGAKAFENIEDAVRNAAVVHLAVKDDATVEDALQNAQKGLGAGTIIVDHTTTSIEGAVRRTAEWTGKGFRFLHAPVFMGPQNALDSTGYMLVSGDQDLIQMLQPQLSSMTGKLLNFGNNPGKAAAMKLTGNLFLIAYTASIADTLTFARSVGITTDQLLGLFDDWNPGATLPRRLERMTGDDFSDPSWRLEMARKDTGLFLKEAGENNMKLHVIPAAASLMDEWIKKGHGAEDWSIIGKPE